MQMLSENLYKYLEYVHLASAYSSHWMRQTSKHNRRGGLTPAGKYFGVDKQEEGLFPATAVIYESMNKYLISDKCTRLMKQLRW